MAGGDDSVGPVPPPRAQPGDLSALRSSRRGPTDPMAALTRFVGEGVVDNAARSRRRLRWQSQLAVEEGTWLGLLCELAESQAMTVIDTTIGRRLRGSIAAVGSDFVSLTTSTGGQILLAIAAISAVQLSPGQSAGAGKIPATDRTTLSELLGELAIDRPVLTWHLTERTSVTGQLIGVGRGFAHLRLAGTPPPTSYLPIGDRTMITLDG